MRCFVFAGWDDVAAIAFAGGSLFSKQGGLESRKLMLVSCFKILGEPAEKNKENARGNKCAIDWCQTGIACPLTMEAVLIFLCFQQQTAADLIFLNRRCHLMRPSKSDKIHENSSKELINRTDQRN